MIKRVKTTCSKMPISRPVFILTRPAQLTPYLSTSNPYLSIRENGKSIIMKYPGRFFLCQESMLWRCRRPCRHSVRSVRRAARRGRPRPHGDPRSLREIHISAPSSALARARPRRAVRPYRVSRVPTRSAAPPQHAPDTEKINPGHLVH